MENDVSNKKIEDAFSWRSFLLKTGLKALFWGAVWVAMPVVGLIGGGLMLARAVLIGGSNAIGSSGFYQYLLDRRAERKERNENRKMERMLSRQEKRDMKTAGGLFKEDGSVNLKALPDGVRLMSSGKDHALLHIRSVERTVETDGKTFTMRFASESEALEFMEFAKKKGWDRTMTSSVGQDGVSTVGSTCLSSFAACAEEFFADRQERFINVPTVDANGGRTFEAAKIYRSGTYSPDVSNTRIILRFDSEDAMLNAINGNDSLKGSVAIVDNDLSEVTTPWYITLPATVNNLKCLAYNGADINLCKEYNNIGRMSDLDINLSLMLNDIRRNSYALSTVVNDLDLSQATASGMKAGEYSFMSAAARDFAKNNGLERGSDQVRNFEKSYKDELSRIVSVERDFDPYNQNLGVTCVFRDANGKVDQHTFLTHLDDKDISRYMARDKAPSEAELKDVALRCLSGRGLCETFSSKYGYDESNFGKVIERMVPDHDTIESLKIEDKLKAAEAEGVQNAQKPDLKDKPEALGMEEKEKDDQGLSAFATSGETDVISGGEHYVFRDKTTGQEGVSQTTEVSVETKNGVDKSFTTEDLSGAPKSAAKKENVEKPAPKEDAPVRKHGMRL